MDMGNKSITVVGGAMMSVRTGVGGVANVN